MNELEIKRNIVESLGKFDSGDLYTAALGLLKSLGYSSDRLLRVSGVADFLHDFDPEGRLNSQHAILNDWKNVEFLFQLTQDDIQSHYQQRMAFPSELKIDNQRIESYLFFAIKLKQPTYTRTQLATITRAVNRIFPMPAMLLFLHGKALTLSIINREISRRDQSRDVLRKVTLVKDINFSDPLRAHIDILFDLSFDRLQEDFRFHNFVGLHHAWEKRLDSYKLNERFYQDIANWYFWALKDPDVTFPYSVKTEEARSMFFIRLITRIIFCWFLQEKGLMPRSLFRTEYLAEVLKDLSPQASTYYQAVLQNLFFATLNQPPEKRAFRGEKSKGWYDQNRGITNIYRHKELLKDPESFLNLLKSVPFVNGGLFDCLDQVYAKSESRKNVRLDGFSDNPKDSVLLPNDLFFGDERRVDLKDVYQDARRKKERVRGLVETLSRYKFTVEENTPLEQEIALDPELLGKVFENLLASYNEDTRTTARKATGSFYTPREVVNFMVDETLIAYFLKKLGSDTEDKKLEEKLRSLFAAHIHDFQNPFTPQETAKLIEAIDSVKVLDPACGSGAFPMGALHRLVNLLAKLDPNNHHWKEQQLERARADRKLAEEMQDDEIRKHTLSDIEERIKDIEQSFNTHYHELDYARKLFLIENCIYGTDIQPVACQIAKLRFFVALLVDQKVNPKVSNSGVRPLPNLETRVVAADTLTPIDGLRKHQQALFEGQVQELREQLDRVRHRHFSARTPQTKAKYREEDAQLRSEIARVLEEAGMPSPNAALLAKWDPYDQNAHASFFDPAWMFSLKDGFDIVVGNPPYVRQEQIKALKPAFKGHYDVYSGTADLYVYFYERGIRLLKPGGAFSYISSNKWFRSAYGGKLRTWLLQQTRLLRLIDFGDAPVFTSIAYPCIVVLTKDGQGSGPEAEIPKNNIEVLNWEQGKSVEQFAEIFQKESFTLPQVSLKPGGWRLESATKLKLLDRIREAGLPLEKYVKGRFYYGLKTGLNEAFVIDGAARKQLIEEHSSSEEVIKPFLRGRDIKRWRVEPQDKWLIFIPWHFPLYQDPSVVGPSAKAEKEFETRYPAIYAHLHRFKKELSARNRAETGVRYEWYALQRWGAEYWREFEQPKIIYPDIYEHQSFAWDDRSYFAGNTCYFIPTGESWLTGLLNSTTIEWVYSNLSNRIRGGYLRAFSDYMRRVPIPEASERQQACLEKLVSSLTFICSNQHSTINSGIDYLDQLVSGLVYELFFPEKLHAQKLFLFKYVEETKLPDLKLLPEGDRQSALQETIERISDRNHPIRSCLFSLQALEVVRIIEGKK